ncbi:MAG: hypothetical protein IPM49_08085 [Flavobacteriales bacterium]|nr:hypothetical protein [Flavobacteriales bacterium]
MTRRPLPGTPPFRALFGLLLLTLTSTDARGQVCVLSEDFSAPTLPSGWDIGPDVERIDANGAGTGEFVPAWRVGTATEANASGYFPVPDGPVDNRFIMANDDAPPCDCDLDSAQLTTPAIDLSTADRTVLTFRFFLDGAFGGDSAWVELTLDGSSWTRVADLGAGNAWQFRTVDLSAADGAPAARLRFHWTDRGGWASGLALDDVCVRGRAAHDLALEFLSFGDLRSSPFSSAAVGLDPAEVPVTQAASPAFTVVLRNKGHLPLFGAHASVSLALNGGPQGQWWSDTLVLLAANDADTVVVRTDWTPTGPGVLMATATVATGGSEDVPGDETGSVQRTLTAAGWADGDGAYAQRTGSTLAGLDAGGAGYMAGCRYEIQADDQVHGLGVRLDAGTEVGAWVIGHLLNTDLQPIASTDTIRITDADVQVGLAWGWSFLPFDAPVPVIGGTDVLAMVEQVPDSGLVRLALGGDVRPGAALVRELSALAWSYPLRAPLVRLHLTPVAASVPEPTPRAELAIRQDDELLTIQAPWPIRTIRVLDATGRTVRVQGPDGAMAAVTLGGLAEGAYLLIVEGQDAQATARFVRTR